VTRGQEVFHQIQAAAQTDHGQHFVLKGGILLAAYGTRRPTRDVHAPGLRATVSGPPRDTLPGRFDALRGFVVDGSTSRRPIGADGRFL